MEERKSGEGYSKKRLRNEGMKYIRNEGIMPKMKEQTKTHKEIGLRPEVNGKGMVLEYLEEEKAKVF